MKMVLVFFIVYVLDKTVSFVNCISYCVFMVLVGRAVSSDQPWLLVVHSVGQALVYHLSDVKGMSLWPDKFAAVGLSPSATQNAARVAGSFMLKARELQQSVFFGFFPTG